MTTQPYLSTVSMAKMSFRAKPFFGCIRSNKQNGLTMHGAEYSGITSISQTVLRIVLKYVL